MLKIIGIGEIVWDCFPSGRKLGGAPLNFAFFAKELGAESYVVSAVGKDELGSETIEAVGADGVSTAFIQRNSFPTGCVAVSLDAAGVPQYDIRRGAAWDAIECTEKELALVGDASCICWGSLSQRSQRSAESVMAMVNEAPESCLKVFDINIRQDYYTREVVERSLACADVLKLNEDELPLVASLLGIHSESAIREISSRYGIRCVVFTCGAAFSEVWVDGELLSHIPTPKVDVVDTVGAGDSFTAAFVTSLLSGKSVADSHRKATSVAAYVCTCRGAIAKLENHNI